VGGAISEAIGGRNLGDREPDCGTRSEEGRGVGRGAVNDPLFLERLGFYKVGWARVMKEPLDHKPKEKGGGGDIPRGGARGGDCKIMNRALPERATHSNIVFWTNYLT
jgi:hypothetical protein